MDSGLILPVAIGLLILCIGKKVFSFPLSILKKCIYNSVLGAIMLYIVNFFGVVHIEITFFKALFAGIFGIPGVIVLIIIKLI